MKLRYVLVLIALLLASIALNYYLFQRGRNYYLQLNELRLDPLGLSYYDNDWQEQDLKTVVVFFGDSRAGQWPAPPNLDRLAFVNRGIGAQTSEQVVLRFKQHVAPLRPQIVVVQVGINDLKTIPLFPGRQEAIVARCKENVRRIVQQSTELGATVILTTIFPTGPVPLERRPFWSGEVALAIDEVNAYIHSLAGADFVVLDAHAILADDAGRTRAEYRADFLHLNAAGYEALNQALAELLAQINSRVNEQRRAP
jgi:lysophospholipase L1-like esterase